MVGSTTASPITVTHGLGSYPVYVEPGILATLATLVARHLNGRAVALVTDTTVGRLYEEWESGGGGAWRRRTGERATPDAHPCNWITRLSVPAGEEAKTRRNWAELSDALLERGVGRDGGLVALGGGVVGDLGGFVAATYLRGIPYMQVPTTLLAMVDASVGGKTGVNTEHGKNLIGAFHPPTAVVTDPLTLRSLPEREYRSGLAEVVKHGVIADAAYFDWIEDAVERIGRREVGALTQLVHRSVEIKAAVVGEDEQESGRRAILNAGHTVAHALERESGYRIVHGEAVALGLVAECAIAERLSLAASGLRERVAGLLGQLGLPIRLPAPLPAGLVVAAMSVDKKNRGMTETAGTGRGADVRFALATRVGAMHRNEGGWTIPVEPAAIRAGLAAIG